MKRRKYVLGDKIYAQSADGRSVVVGRVDIDDGVGSSQDARRRLIDRMNGNAPEKLTSSVRPNQDRRKQR